MTEPHPPADPTPLAPKPIAIRQEHRCGKCGRLIAVGVIKAGTVLEIKCRCNAVNVLSAA